MSARKYILGIIALFFVIFGSAVVSADDTVSPVGQAATTGIGGASVPFCDGVDANGNPECGFQQGIDTVGGVGGFRTDVGATDLIQQIVGYILSFVSLIAVLYIIYAGFQILTGNGEEEKLKKSKQTILYVILGIIVIWLAWPITVFVIGALKSSPV
ncbi:pilin [Candidatus Gracilibacteria bacterium]|nr:pilin [Candidatus Gracilibacteria bacterium]